MKNTKDEIFDELIGSRVDELLEPDDYYEHLATPLKRASVIKNEHRDEIIKLLKMDSLKKQLVEAEKLIKEHLSEVSPESKHVLDEIDRSSQHMLDYFQKLESAEKPIDEKKPVLFKDIFGVSDNSLLQIYALAKEYVTKKDYAKAQALLTYLTMLAPNITAFWLSLGICFQALHHDKEAIDIFNITKMLDKSDPASYIYAAESYLNLKEKQKAKIEIDEVKPLLNNQEGPWKNTLAFVLQNLGG